MCVYIYVYSWKQLPYHTMSSVHSTPKLSEVYQTLPRQGSVVAPVPARCGLQSYTSAQPSWRKQLLHAGTDKATKFDSTCVILWSTWALKVVTCLKNLPTVSTSALADSSFSSTFTPSALNLGSSVPVAKCPKETVFKIWDIFCIILYIKNTKGLSWSFPPFHYVTSAKLQGWVQKTVRGIVRRPWPQGIVKTCLSETLIQKTDVFICFFSL